MADHLTKTQDALDEFVTQMYAALHYISNYHPPAQIPSQPFQHDPRYLNSANLNEGTTNGVTHTPDQLSPESPSGPISGLPENATSSFLPDAHSDIPPQRDEEGAPLPDHPVVFQNALQKIAKELVQSEQGFETLVRSLPGADKTLEQQDTQLWELEDEMKSVKTEWSQAQRTREELLEKVEGMMMKIRRIY